MEVFAVVACAVFCGGKRWLEEVYVKVTGII